MCALEISEVYSAILKNCAVDVFRTAHQYLRSAHRYLILEGLSGQWEVHTDLWEARTDSGIWEAHTDLWEMCTDNQEGRSDV